MDDSAIARSARLTLHPHSPEKRTARSSNKSGWLGGSPVEPKSSSVRTRPTPNIRAQSRLTATRAVSGLSGEATHRANASRSGVRASPASASGTPGETGSSLSRKFPRAKRCVGRARCAGRSRSTGTATFSSPRRRRLSSANSTRTAARSGSAGRSARRASSERSSRPRRATSGKAASSNTSNVTVARTADPAGAATGAFSTNAAARGRRSFVYAPNPHFDFAFRLSPGGVAGSGSSPRTAAN